MQLLPPLHDPPRQVYLPWLCAKLKAEKPCISYDDWLLQPAGTGKAMSWQEKRDMAILSAAFVVILFIIVGGAAWLAR